MVAVELEGKCSRLKASVVSKRMALGNIFKTSSIAMRNERLSLDGASHLSIRKNQGCS